MREKTHKSPLDRKVIQLVNPKGNHPEYSLVVKDREAGHAAVHGVVESDMT